MRKPSVQPARAPQSRWVWGVVLILAAAAVSAVVIYLAATAQPKTYSQESLTIGSFYDYSNPMVTIYKGATFGLAHMWTPCDPHPGCLVPSGFAGLSGFANTSGGSRSYFNLSAVCDNGNENVSCQGQAWFSPGGQLGVWWDPARWAFPNLNYTVLIGVQS